MVAALAQSDVCFSGRRIPAGWLLCAGLVVLGMAAYRAHASTVPYDPLAPDSASARPWTG